MVKDDQFNTGRHINELTLYCKSIQITIKEKVIQEFKHKNIFNELLNFHANSLLIILD